MKDLYPMKRFGLFFILALLLTSCAAFTSPSPQSDMGMGDSGMMTRHHTKIPAEYAGKTNPVEANGASVERGKAIYEKNCATCHGGGGKGDGPFAEGLDPAPAPVDHTSQMMADDYLFWRISEGGAVFKSSMPAWISLEELARWDVINYMRTLSKPTQDGALADPTAQ
jgi:mono/diheme cytochrome c family protein